jgi:hypothetical protein
MLLIFFELTYYKLVLFIILSLFHGNIIQQVQIKN